jgi:hypothetical protein
MMNNPPAANHMIKFDDPRIDGPEFVDLDEAARRMDMTKAQIMHLIRIGALRYQLVGGTPWVQPAILSGRAI